jgi:cytochrome b561
LIVSIANSRASRTMLRNDENAYGLVAIVFHWTIAALFAGQLVLGYSMTRTNSMALQFELIQWHKSFGFVVLGLAVLRLAWRLTNPRPRALPSMPVWERIAARGAHFLLLTATIAVPLAGWALVSTSTLAIPTLAFNRWLIPHLPLAPLPGAEAFWRGTHELLAYASAVLIAGHAAAALRHHFLIRDTVLLRMLGAGRAPDSTGEPR